MQECYNNYEQPIEEMKRLTNLNIPFAFKHKRSDGSTVIVEQASLRKQQNSQKDRNAPYKLQYTNLKTNEYKSCYIPLLLEFNKKKIIISR